MYNFLGKRGNGRGNLYYASPQTILPSILLYQVILFSKPSASCFSLQAL
jgi:hypothetical protein